MTTSMTASAPSTLSLAGMTHITVCLPCYGEPYIHAITKGEPDLKVLQEVVGGDIESYPAKEFKIHPMFVAETRRWAMADVLRQAKGVRIYVNEDGYERCSPNMATVIVDPRRRVGGCPHLMGEVCFLVPIGVFLRTRVPIAALAIAEEDGKKLDEVEPEDEEEEEEMKARFAAKGWDYTYAGRVYQRIAE